MNKRLNHKLNVDAIKTVKDVKNVFYTMELVASMDEDNPIYQVAKEYFTIPYVSPELEFKEPRKSIEEIQQEFEDKFDVLMARTIAKFEYSKESAEKGYNYKFDRINQDFEYAKEHGQFPQKLTFTVGDGLSVNNHVTSNFVIRSTPMGVGYWDVKPNIQIWLQQKPNWLVRRCAKIFFDFGWKSAV